MAADIGNTNTNFGLFSSNRLIRRFSVPTGNYSFRLISRQLGGCRVSYAVICSVVPEATNSLEKLLKKTAHSKPCLLGRDIHVPIKNLYRKPSQVGMDRLVNAYAGCRLYGAPLILVDFGTAITFDVVSVDKAYLGGMILPGFGISLDALFAKTALLPRVKLDKPVELVGRDTRSSMLSGLVHGFSSLTDGLVDKIRTSLRIRAMVIGTGGDIGLIAGYCRRIDKIDRDLTLKGLKLVYNKSVYGV